MSDHDPWEARMGHELERRASGLAPTDLTLDQVKGRAGSIRRRRRLAVATGVLATVAVLVPAGLVAQQGLGGPDAGPAPAASPSSTPTAVPTRATDGPTEDGVGFDRLRGTTWVRADGSTVELATTYRGGTVLGDTLIGLRSDDDTGQQTLDVVTPDGEVTESIPIASGFAVDDDRRVIAYVEPDGDLMTLWDPAAGDEGRVALETDLVSAEGLSAYPVAVLGGPSCYETPRGDGCAVVFNAGDGTSPPRSASSHGITDEIVFDDPPPVAVTDHVGELVSVQVSSQDAGSCNGIYEVATASYRWETCDRYLLDLSPSGGTVAATHAYLDGYGIAYVALVDTASQEELARLDPEEGVVIDQQWLDDDTLLATVTDGRESSIWAVRTDGSVERVTEPVAMRDETTPDEVLLR